MSLEPWDGVDPEGRVLVLYTDRDTDSGGGGRGQVSSLDK